jgi:hypothetical protein
MIKIIYLIITAVILLFSIINLFDEKNWKNQLTHLIVILPLLLRVLLIK